VAQKEHIGAAERFESMNIISHFRFKVIRVGADTVKTLYLGEEVVAKQTLEITDKAKTTGHPHRRERILRKDSHPCDQGISGPSGFASSLAEQPVQRLRASAAQQYDHEIAILGARQCLELSQHRLAYGLFRRQDLSRKLVKRPTSKLLFRRLVRARKPYVLAARPTVKRLVIL
jgi:hypothetical protein